jgi:hypothetical protein
MLPFYLFISEFSHAKSDWTDAEFFLAHRYSKHNRLINTSFFHRYSLRYPENIRRIDIVYHSITDPDCLSRIRIFPHLGTMGQKEPYEGSGLGFDPDLIRLLDSDPDLGSVSVFS